MVAVTPCAALWFLFGAPLAHRYQKRVKIDVNDNNSESNRVVRKSSQEKNGTADNDRVAGGGGGVLKLKPIREDHDRFEITLHQHNLSYTFLLTFSPTLLHDISTLLYQHVTPSRILSHIFTSRPTGKVIVPPRYYHHTFHLAIRHVPTIVILLVAFPCPSHNGFIWRRMMIRIGKC